MIIYIWIQNTGLWNHVPPFKIVKLNLKVINKPRTWRSRGGAVVWSKWTWLGRRWPRYVCRSRWTGLCNCLKAFGRRGRWSNWAFCWTVGLRSRRRCRTGTSRPCCRRSCGRERERDLEAVAVEEPSVEAGSRWGGGRARGKALFVLPRTKVFRW